MFYVNMNDSKKRDKSRQQTIMIKLQVSGIENAVQTLYKH